VILAPRSLRTTCCCSLLVLLAACSNGRGSVEEESPPAQGAQQSFLVGGAVNGLAAAGLILQNNGAGNLPLTANGPFTFPDQVRTGAAYNVTVSSQPSGQTCTVTNGAGTVTSSNVTDIRVTCSTAGATFVVGGMVSGLTGTGLVLQLNGIEELAVLSTGSFTFGVKLAAGASYEVSIKTQPSNPSQVCTVARGSGTIAGDVTNVSITCSGSAFSIGGAVNGLLGSGLVLQNNGADDLSVAANGVFTFPRELATGARYSVTVRTQPENPIQACTVANGSGTVGGSDVTTVVVSCNASDFTIGGVVAGLAGSGLTLRNNGTDELAIHSNGSFVFPTALPNGASYSVDIAAQPTDPGQTCRVSNGSGLVRDNNVTDIAVNCVATGFLISGHVSKLRGSGLVLQNNGDDDLGIASNGRFAFVTRLPSGAPYDVTIAAQPRNPDQVCEVKDGSGTVRDSDVEDIEVKCADDD